MEGWCTKVSERPATDWLKVRKREIRSSLSLHQLSRTSTCEGCGLLEKHWMSFPMVFIHVFLVTNKNMDFFPGWRE